MHHHPKGVVMTRHRAPTGLGWGRVLVRGVLAAATVVLALAAPAAAQAGAWTQPATLAGPIPRANVPDRFPTAAVNRHGLVVVAWDADATHNLRVKAAIGTARGHFGDAVVLAPKGMVRAAAIADDGTAMVIWAERSGLMAAVRPPGGHFGRAQRITGTLRGEFGVPVVAVDRAGNFLVAWSRFVRAGSRHTWQVQIVSRPAHGTFGKVSTLGLGTDVHVAFNARGDAVVSWTSIVESGGTFPVPYVRTAVAQVATRPVGGTFGAPVTLSGTPTWAASAVLTDEGTVGAVWEKANGPESDPYGPIQTSTQPAGGAVETPVDAPVVNARRAFTPMVFYGSRGELVTLWQQKTHSTPFVHAAPLHWATRMPGTAFGPRRTITAAEAGFVQLAPTGDGRALLLWSDTRLHAALYRSSVGFVKAAAPPAQPGPFATRSLAAAGDYAVFAWQQASDRRLVVSVRRL